MTKEREDELKLTMFPLMLQALYNAQFYINKKTEGQDWRFIDNTDTNPVGEAFRQMEDLRLIIRAFRDAGILPRCPMEEEKNEFSGAALYRMRHFTELEKDHVLELFNPDKRDYELTMEKVRERVDEIVKGRDEEIDALKDEVHKWKSIAGGETGELRRDFCVKHNQALMVCVAKLGDPKVLDLVEKLPYCSSVDEFRIQSSVLKNEIMPCIQQMRALQRKFTTKQKDAAFDVLAQEQNSEKKGDQSATHP